MTRDAITEGNRLLKTIEQAEHFWDNYGGINLNVPEGLKSMIDTVIDRYIDDQEWRLGCLSGYYEQKEDGDNDETV